MTILDCESVESTYNSLESILGIGIRDLKVAFKSFNMDSFYAENPHYPDPPENLLLEKIIGRSSTLPAFDQVCWFHLTRTVPTNTFDEGILPLGEQIEKIWVFLYSLIEQDFPQEEWNNFRCDLGNSHSADLYRMKVNDSLHWGPYGVLVKDIAFRAKEVGNHEYFRTPEIVEDICTCFNEKYNLDLQEAFFNNTKPCIVKFIDETPRPDCIEAAMYYLYMMFYGNELSLFCNTCFDGEAAAVPKERILNIKFPSYSQ